MQRPSEMSRPTRLKESTTQQEAGIISIVATGAAFSIRRREMPPLLKFRNRRLASGLRALFRLLNSRFAHILNLRLANLLGELVKWNVKKCYDDQECEDHHCRESGHEQQHKPPLHDRLAEKGFLS